MEKVVGSVKKGIKDLKSVLNSCNVKGPYGLTITDSKEAGGVVVDGKYVVREVPTAIDYHIISKDELDMWVGKILDNIYDEDIEYYDLESILSTLKPEMSMAEYLKNEYMQLGLDLFISTMKDAFEPAYIRYLGSGNICIWFVDMSKY